MSTGTRAEPPRRRGLDSFTLIETMIASVIMLLALVSVLALAGQGFRYLTDLRRWARSSQVLQQKMEDIRLVTVWTNIWAMDGTSYTNNEITGVPYTGTVEIDPYTPTYPTNISVRVTLTVTWINSASRPVTNRLSTLVTQNGLNKYIF